MFAVSTIRPLLAATCCSSSMVAVADKMRPVSSLCCLSCLSPASEQTQSGNSRERQQPDTHGQFWRLQLLPPPESLVSRFSLSVCRRRRRRRRFNCAPSSRRTKNNKKLGRKNPLALLIVFAVSLLPLAPLLLARPPLPLLLPTAHTCRRWP